MHAKTRSKQKSNKASQSVGKVGEKRTGLTVLVKKRKRFFVFSLSCGDEEESRESKTGIWEGFLVFPLCVDGHLSILKITPVSFVSQRLL